MKKRVPIILTLIVCFSMCGCSEKDSSKESIIESVEESVSASVSESLAEESDAARLEMEVLKQEVVDEMVGPFDCFAVGETATLADIEFTVTSISSLGPQEKSTGKMSDYTIKVEFSITNNSDYLYIPLADMRLIVNGDLIQSYDANPESDERAEYDAGVEPGKTKTFSNVFLYNLSNPADNIAVARWAPFSSSVSQDTLVVYFDINTELEIALQERR